MLKRILRLVPIWFLPVLGLIYATGFLVVTIFLGRLGIRDAATEAWKAKYIHIGLLCLVFPLLINGIVYPLQYLYRTRKQNPKLTLGRIIPGAIIVGNWVLCFYIFCMFTRHDDLPPYAFLGMLPLLVILSVTILGMSGIQGLEMAHKKIKDAVGQKWPFSVNSPYNQTIVLRWVLCGVVVLLDFWFLYECKDLLMMTRDHWRGVLLHFALIFFFGYIPWRFFWYSKKLEGDIEKNAIAIWTVCFCILAPLYYLYVASFALTFYSYIPATRGGRL